MRANTKLLLHLYPAAWRKRYGSEFEALLDESHLNWRTMFDLMKGATKMHLSTPSLPKMIGLIAGIGLVLGVGASYLLTPRYISTAVVRYSGGADGLEQIMQTQNEVLSRTSIAALMQDPQLDLYSKERESVPLENVVGKFRQATQIYHAGADGNTFVISFVYSDPAKARATVQALVTRFITSQFAHDKAESVGSDSAIDRLQQRVAELERRLNIQASRPSAPVAHGGRLEVLDPPSLPVSPIYPNRAMCAATGFSCGILLALTLYAFRRPTNRILPLPSTV